VAVAGTTFPGGSYRVSREENERLCRAVGAVADPDGRAHPIFYYIATQSSMGISVAELLALCDFDVADGPLMVGSEVSFQGELRIDQDYGVTGKINSLVRKPSRAFGAVDLLSFELSLLNHDNAPIVTCTNQWVLPRREEATV
jgi:hypothetical protein